MVLTRIRKLFSGVQAKRLAIERMMGRLSRAFAVFLAHGPRTPLGVNRDSATRRARRLAVQSDVGELCFVLRNVRSREAVPAFIKSLAPSVLWLACEVQVEPLSLRSLKCSPILMTAFVSIQGVVGWDAINLIKEATA
jgi:hypothetical protein